jgi:cellulose synthase/poly-beta-1,6-N-acetylglucosamine synthase-like glycosyltransferase
LDRWDALKAAVQSCTEQSRPPEEIIVVIDHNEDLRERAQVEFLGARVVANESTKGLSGARNTGVVYSSGDVIAFLDDDAFAEATWLEELLAPMSDPAVAGTGGFVVPFWESGEAAWFPETFYWILGCSFAGLPTTNAPIRNPIGANMAIRRHVFSSVGGFTSGLGRIGVTPLGCEETELCIRYTSHVPGHRFMFARAAVVHHRVPASRLTWHYFWTRCWAEGLSKAAVSTLVGANAGLAAERKHVMGALPRELVQSLTMIRRNPRVALTRMALIVAGTSLAMAGVVRGKLALLREPLQTPVNEQPLFLKNLRDSDAAKAAVEGGDTPSENGTQPTN